ncbi:MBL fold metallo-hydrolase [Candidatus Micrarchaeota archaeon]|jgi:glyoxylase-like metal-dependent hydrolase (beta-lactamase superfamily II)|nr:MBL fold metallo-hydrolase [Candidatus Micrarchaeota archaeon]
MKILKGGPYSSVCYALESEKGILLIDTGDGSVKFDFEPALAILTHNHSDHTKGVKDNWENVYLHPNDFKKNEYSFIPKKIKKLDFENIKWGNWNLDILHTPGHTPGSICLYDKNKKVLFSGDTIFNGGGVGRTDLGGNPIQMKQSLSLLKKLKIEKLFPGHEY